MQTQGKDEFLSRFDGGAGIPECDGERIGTASRGMLAYCNLKDGSHLYAGETPEGMMVIISSAEMDEAYGRECELFYRDHAPTQMTMTDGSYNPNNVYELIRRIDYWLEPH